MTTIVRDELALSADWREWVAENVLLEVADEQIIATLEGIGVTRAHAAALIAEERASPSFKAAWRATRRLRKLESLLGIYQELSSLPGLGGMVQRRAGLSRDDFLRSYYALNRPVVLTDALAGSVALASWTPARLKEVCGDEVVEVMTRRSGDDRYEARSDQHKELLPFRDYAELIINSGPTNDFYMVANNHFLERRAARPLLDDLGPLPPYLADDSRDGSVFLWFGPGGTVTPLHHDIMNVLLVQVYGEKRVRLVPSSQTPLVYNHESVYSEVDCAHPEPAKHPLFNGAQVVECVLSPGEALFIPVGWWHHVESLSTSISLSFTNFDFPNHYDWVHP